MKNAPDGKVAAALRDIRHRLDMLASINAEHMLIPGEPQERSHQMVEKATASTASTTGDYRGLASPRPASTSSSEPTRAGAPASAFHTQEHAEALCGRGETAAARTQRRAG